MPLSSLTGIRQQLLQTIRSLSHKDLNRRPSDAEWSVAQIAEHLHLVERAVASQIRHGLFEISETPFVERPIETVLDRSVRVKVPNPALEPKNEPISSDELTEKLTRSREQLLEAIKGFTPEDLRRRAFSHPLFGMLSLQQWITFLEYHERRHLEQISETMKKLGI
ncbi:DinB family protein [Staphylospora marina]|uniref:DinB family protein n=1 Tax=Staphylospora marina TaxID=2490858 RepID=UPI000F5BAC89|nr:DinB family protein [Staphylospora marina]